jgi:signal peptidase II
MRKESKQLIVVNIGLFFLFVIDRVTKWWAFHTLSEKDPIHFLNYFRLELYLNEGVIFSIPLYKPLIYFITITIIGVIIFFLYGAYRKRNINLIVSLSLILIGTFSNLLDRIYNGAIIDLINLRFLPVFNFADCIIIVGAVILVFKASNFQEKEL